MELRQLRYFVKMVELGNMTRAAKELFVAQSALSQQLAKLEASIGSRLLDRNAHGVRPTQPGRLFYKHAKTILRQIEDTSLAMRAEIESPSGEVALALPASAARLMAVPLLRKIIAEYPTIQLRLIELPSAAIPSTLLRSEADIAIAVDMPQTKSLRVMPLLTEDLFAAFQVAPGAARAKSITLKELARLPLILPSQHNSIRGKLETLFAKRRHPYTLVAEINVTSLLALTALAGLGATVLPWSAVSEDAHLGQLHALPIVQPAIKRELSLCLCDDVMPSAATQVVLQAVREVCEQLVDSGTWLGVRLQRKSADPV